MNNVIISRLFSFIALTFMLLCVSRAAYPGQERTIFLRDQLPQTYNFVILTLNNVDKIKVPIPTGGMAGHFSLLDLGVPEAEPMTFSRKARSWLLYGEGTPRLNENSQQLYLLEQVELTARSGPHRAHCIFTREGKRLDGMGRYWPETNFREFSFTTFFRKETYVSEVWCVAEEERVLKILIDPPPSRPLSSSSSSTSRLPFMSSSNLVPIVELPVQDSGSFGVIAHAFSKVTSEDGELLRVNRAALFYDYLVSPVMICRPIVYDGWPAGSLYQGPPLSGELEGEPRAALEQGTLAFAYYCDNWTSYGYYTNNIYRTGWDPEWTSGEEPYNRSFQR